jgi:Pyruvate/2-oxoacid:ferredoxin oxidoreductase delta subunit
MTTKTLPFAITLDPGTSLANHTGSWRTERPVYLDRLPPCNNACPAARTSSAGCTMRRRATITPPGRS